MRLWSFHPRYLDSKGLVALWRESLLAQNVLLGLTKGYKNHPQLDRFKNCEDPIKAIGQYLLLIWAESVERQMKFNVDKIKFRKANLKKETIVKINVTNKQVLYEFVHLQAKLAIRNKVKYKENYDLFILLNNVDNNRIFNVVAGEIESWEKIPEYIKAWGLK